MSRPIAVQFLGQKLEKSLGNIQGLLDNAKLLVNADLTLEVKLKELIFGYLDQAKESIFESRMPEEEEKGYKEKVKEKLKERQIQREEEHQIPEEEEERQIPEEEERQIPEEEERQIRIKKKKKSSTNNPPLLPVVLGLIISAVMLVIWLNK